MRRLLFPLLLVIAGILGACSPDDTPAGSPITGESGAPLNDDAVGPSEQQSTMGE